MFIHIKCLYKQICVSLYTKYSVLSIYLLWFYANTIHSIITIYHWYYVDDGFYYNLNSQDAELLDDNISP